MSYSDRAVEVFLTLLRAGLWGTEAVLAPADPADWKDVFTLASEQTVIGLVGEGLQHASGTLPPESVLHAFIGTSYGTELRNREMNAFLSGQYAAMSEAGIRAVVLKGQGIACCYRNPMWRQSGDIDYLLSAEDYASAKDLLVPKADEADHEDKALLHYPLHFGDIVVELHGTLHTDISRRIDRCMSAKQQALFSKEDFRYEKINGVTLRLPSLQFDVVYVFTHILHHFYQGGIGLRQLCDWARLLYVSSGRLDVDQVRKDLESMHLAREWQVFAAFLVDRLGMDPARIPLYSEASPHRSEALLKRILKSGNFGHNEQARSLEFRNYFHRKIASFFGRGKEILQSFPVFPGKTLVNLASFFWNGTRKVLRGE